MTNLNLRKCDWCGTKFYHAGMDSRKEEGLTIEFESIEFRVYSQIKEKSKSLMSNVEFKQPNDFCKRGCFIEYMTKKLNDLIDENSLKNK